MRPLLLLLLLAAACGGARPVTAPPAPTTAPAPVLTGLKVMLFPTQAGAVPVADAPAVRSAVARDQLDAELAFWLPQLAGNVQWVLPSSVQRAITRSPSLEIDINNLAVSSFQRAQVKRVGDPLYGDLRKLAAVLDARVAVIPIAAEMLGASQTDARVQIATAVVDALDGSVLWFGILESQAGTSTDAAIASAAQAFARAFAGKRN